MNLDDAAREITQFIASIERCEIPKPGDFLWPARRSTPSKWDAYGLRMAREAASLSKDPSTKVGAVILDPKRRLVSTGYNGFARGDDDAPERYADRDAKLRDTIHAELNAILFARRDLEGHTLYTWPFAPCSGCSKHIIQVGIARVVAPKASPELEKRWGEDLAYSASKFRRAGVVLDLYEA